MRSYGQFCAIARSLDLIGDRWTLLIVRELWLRPSRYTDLKAGLPGIATNLLAERLRELEAEGLVSKTDEPPPVATAIYRLTARGAALEPVLRELLQWGEPLMRSGQGEDAFCAHWLDGILAVAFASAHASTPLVFSVAVEGGAAEVIVRAGPDGVQVRRDVPADRAVEATVVGTPDELLALLRGDVDLDTLTTAGSPAALNRVRVLLDACRAGSGGAEDAVPGVA